MKKYINKNNTILFLSFIFVIVLLVFIFFNPFIYFKLNKKNTITLNVNENFEYPKVDAYAFKYNISNRIKQKGNVDNTKIGTYTLNYSVKYFLTVKKLSIKVNVIDNEKPTIELNGKKEVVLCPGYKYEEEGYSAIDNYDGDITNKVIVENFENFIKYSVKDTSGNATEISRKVLFEDKISPEITLYGSQHSSIEINSSYKESGYNAIDDCDGDITKRVEIISNLDTSKVGTYTITYKVKDSKDNETSVYRSIDVVNSSNGFYKNIVMGPTYINGILIVNKNYALPKDYGNGVDNEAYNAFLELQNAAKLLGYTIPLLSGYRDYNYQSRLYNNYVLRDGKVSADTYSARPGHSEHQTGLAFDVGKLDNYYGNTNEGKWLHANAHKFGFIIRYPKGKESITGYQYEPWHIRYLGINHATNIYNKGITLEEYLGLS